MADDLTTNGTGSATTDGATVVTAEELSIIPIANQPLALDQGPLEAGFALPFQGSAELELKIKTTTYGLKVDTPGGEQNMFALNLTQKPDEADTASSIVKVRVDPSSRNFEVKLATPQAIPIGPVTIAKVAISVSKGTLPEEPTEPKKPENPEKPEGT